MTRPRTFRVCWIHDDKAGHRKQLAGLEAQLTHELGAESLWYHFRDTPKFSLQKRPDLIVGAGHRTHWPVINTAHQCGAKSCILMAPSLPSLLFDFIIVPKHDGMRPDKRVFCTQGPINPIIPARREQGSKHLILLGGESRHYKWSTSAILEQVSELLASRPETGFLCFDSRRTPLETTNALKALKSNTFELISWKETEDGILDNALYQAAEVFVTPDSISMIYEALTASIPVKLFELDAKRHLLKRSKVVMEIERLKRASMVADIRSTNTRQVSRSPWAARDAAEWLAHRLGITARADNDENRQD